MKEIYVLTGRTFPTVGVFDEGNNYFGESPIVEAYESYEKAKKALDEYLVEIYDNIKTSYFLDATFLDDLTVEDMQRDYNMEDKEDWEEMEVSWSSGKYREGFEFQMYASGIPYGDPEPILPSLKITKCIVKN